MRVVKALFGCLFGLPFALAGLFIASETLLPMVLDWRETQAWVKADATIISLDRADNYTKVDYQYDYQGKHYLSDRVYLASFNDNFGSYHENLYYKLNRTRNNNQVMPVWVNPGNHSEAIIDKEMRWGLFTIVLGFTGFFVLIGLLICYGSLTYQPSQKNKNKRRINRLRREWGRETNSLFDGDEKQTFSEFVSKKSPELNEFIDDASTANDGWQNKKAWKTNRIRSGALTGVIVMWFFFAVLITIGFLVSKDYSVKFTGFNKEFIIAAVVLLVIFLFVLQTFRVTLRYRRFGRVTYVMDPYPGSIGGDVGGYIELKRLSFSDVKPRENPFKITLECVYTYMSGSGKNRSRSESIKWAEEGKPEIQRSATGLMLLFKFSVPGHLPEASVKQAGDYYFWRLKIVGDLSGFDLKRNYNVPVFVGSETSSNVRNDISEQVRELKQYASKETARAVREGNFHLTDLSKVVKIEQVGSDVSLYFPMFRNKALTLFALVFAGGFGFAVYSIYSSFGGGIAGLFTVFFSIPFALVALAAAIASIYLPLNNLTVNLNPSEIRTVRKILFFPVQRRSTTVQSVSRLKIKRSGSTGQGVKKIVHFKIVAECAGAKKITLAEDINGEDLAENFKTFLAKTLNLRSRE